jgi:hypothetical protein
MWVILSRRLRRWLMLMVALPLARLVVRKLSATTQARRPGSLAARTLGHADARINRARGGRRRR